MFNFHSLVEYIIIIIIMSRVERQVKNPHLKNFNAPTLQLVSSKKENKIYLSIV